MMAIRVMNQCIQLDGTVLKRVQVGFELFDKLMLPNMLKTRSNEEQEFVGRLIKTLHMKKGFSLAEILLDDDDAVNTYNHMDIPDEIFFKKRVVKKSVPKKLTVTKDKLDLLLIESTKKQISVNKDGIIKKNHSNLETLMEQVKELQWHVQDMRGKQITWFPT